MEEKFDEVIASMYDPKIKTNDFNQFIESLEEGELVKFITHAGILYPSIVFNRIMIFYAWKWKDISIKVWGNIIRNMAKSEIGLYTLAVFLTRFIEIDGIDLIIKSTDLNDKIMRSLLKIQGKITKLSSMELKEFEELNQSKINFSQIKESLLTQGAKSVLLKKPTLFGLN